MNILQSIENIKIPFPTEGIIRTAQLDDTVAPTDSAQLAVNMNFDRVGAIQTRPGTTQYADDLAAAINNYGTLKNSVVPPGFAELFQFGDTSDIVDSGFANPSAVKISTTKVAVFWSGGNGHGFAQNFSLDETTGSLTGIGTPLEYYTSPNLSNKAIIVNGSFVLNVWSTTSNSVYAALFDCSGDTIVAGTPYNLENGVSDISLAAVDSTHTICFTSSFTTSHIIAFIIASNTGALTVTKPGSDLDVTTVSRLNSCISMNDGIHFLNFWSGSSNSQVQCFSVNTSTWAITAIGSPLSYTGSFAALVNNAISLNDGQHFGNICLLNGVVTAQAFSVNLSTYAVTTIGSQYSGNNATSVMVAAGLNDGLHFVAFYTASAGGGFAQMIAFSAGTFNATGVGAPLGGYSFGDTASISAFSLNGPQAMLVWENHNDQSGEATAFISLGALVNGQWLYAGYGTSVSNLPAGSTTWTAQRTGLATVSKPRFVQYLNYIWMVNGNPQIGGNPIATSKGGTFGTDLIPSGFPGGDFISAGFEGRVWVANATLGVIYYTDIVQFTPPATYSFTYNPAVNFISEIAPQTGETFTALFQVPRALLVFTQNTITRIYGASSVDAYPAYNVGTYSQESIIQTKTGIFFHHSSGFYQFDYGSQPVEVSRRIIDFVKAIPRSNYGNITGVWDGFDNVEWSIGQVTVEGVIFANCYVRYTISTQVWTVYDYAFTTTANIYYDDGTTLNHLVGTSAGKTGQLDTGTVDFGQPFYFEYIDRWRGYTDMYYQTKQISGMNVYSENASGANLLYQIQKSGPNAWLPLGTVTESNNSVMPNAQTDDFDVARFRIVGNTKGPVVVIHGIEILQLTIKGQEEN
jgi:hypothetical protein